MGSRWQLRGLRSEGERVHNPVRGVVHNIHRIKPPPPDPRLSPPVLEGRGVG